MTTALDIIESAYERCNRLSPGETLSADDAARGLKRLNEIVDEWAPRFGLAYLTRITSAAQTGNITLGAGSWAAIRPGSEIIAAAASGLPLQEITQQQYTELYNQTITGLPQVWSQDGLSTVYLWPVPNGQTIRLMTRDGVGEFADQTTEYLLPDGFRTAFAASLAVSMAPVISKLTPELLRAQKEAVGNIDHYEPAILNVDSFNKTRRMWPPRLF